MVVPKLYTSSCSTTTPFAVQFITIE